MEVAIDTLEDKIRPVPRERALKLHEFLVGQADESGVFNSLGSIPKLIDSNPVRELYLTRSNTIDTSKIGQDLRELVRFELAKSLTTDPTRPKYQIFPIENISELPPIPRRHPDKKTQCVLLWEAARDRSVENLYKGSCSGVVAAAHLEWAFSHDGEFLPARADYAWGMLVSSGCIKDCGRAQWEIVSHPDSIPGELRPRGGGSRRQKPKASQRSKKTPEVTIEQMLERVPLDVLADKLVASIWERYEEAVHEAVSLASQLEDARRENSELREQLTKVPSEETTDRAKSTLSRLLSGRQPSEPTHA